MKYVESPQEWLGAGVDVGLFLAGGIVGCPDWQKGLVTKLVGTNLTLLNPRRAEFNPDAGVRQIGWEHSHLLRADAISFWFPCETVCPITLYELGAWIFRPKKVFIGCHPQYQRILDVREQTRLERPKQKVVTSLDDLAAEIIEWSKRVVVDRFTA